MDSSIHSHLISQYVQERIDRASEERLARQADVRLPRIRYPGHRRWPLRAAALQQK